MDTGNCLDYTNRPEINMQPGATNFLLLAAIYGTVDDNSTIQEPGNRSLHTIPLHIQQANDRLDQLYNTGIVEPHWRKLHESELGVVHEIDLADGYRVVVRQLLV